MATPGASGDADSSYAVRTDAPCACNHATQN